MDMARKRVLLVESGKFIGGVISSLFISNKQIHLIEARPASPGELLRAVQESRPSIIVLDDTLHEYLAQLLDYMQHSEGLRVVVVSADSNQVAVYEKQQYPVRQTADLFAVL